MSTHPMSPGPARITVVESEACHFCEDAHRTLAELAGRYPFALRQSTCAARTGSG